MITFERLQFHKKILTKTKRQRQAKQLVSHFHDLMAIERRTSAHAHMHCPNWSPRTLSWFRTDFILFLSRQCADCNTSDPIIFRFDQWKNCRDAWQWGNGDRDSPCHYTSFSRRENLSSGEDLSQLMNPSRSSKHVLVPIVRATSD